MINKIKEYLLEKKEKKLLRDIILYIVKWANERNIKVDKTWIQKIIFLLQYYDTETGKLTTRKKLFKTISYIIYD